MKTTLLLLSVAILFLTLGVQTQEHYKQLHFSSFVVDTHNDVVQRILSGEDISGPTKHGQSDLPRFIVGGLRAEMFSIWVPPDNSRKSYYDQANEQIDSIESFARRNPAKVGMAYDEKTVEKLYGEGKFVAMLGMEGGHPIDNDLKKLQHFYDRGVRYMTLTWNNSTDWATSASDETDPNKHLKHKGLTKFGKDVVKKMNALGMMVDVSHVGEQTFWDVLKTTTKPVIASHSSSWTLCHHRRNLKDAQLKALAKNGGVVFVNFAPWFIDSTFGKREEAMLVRNRARIDSFKSTLKNVYPFVEDMYVAEFLKPQYDSIRPSLMQLMNHFDYIAKLIGTDHVGIGSDFDGITVTEKDMDDVSYLPNITRELVKRGYSDGDIKKILGGNFLRVLKAVEIKH
ncbi:MAG TPA: dipeptidase [Bacteroidota bacterium]|nr:dipeptidase [Bacteroidota bacterium]